MCPEEESKATATGQLGPGELILFDGETGQVLHSDEVKEALATARPHGDQRTRKPSASGGFIRQSADDRFDAGRPEPRVRHTAEERRLVIADMAQATTRRPDGRRTGLAVLANKLRRLTEYPTSSSPR